MKEDEMGNAVAHIGEMRNSYNIFVGKPEGDLGDLGVDGKIILKLVLGKEGGRVWARCIWLGIGISSRPL
jgi:hypothetical protein